jgi:gliding motility-associated-like protein
LATFLRKYWLLCVAVLFLVLPQTLCAQIRVINPCKLNETQTSVPSSTGTGTTMPTMMTDLKKIYHVSTTFIDLDQNSTISVWDFGDGTTAIGRVVQHQYKMVGTYLVTLVRTNGPQELINVQISNSVPIPYFLESPDKLDEEYCTPTTLDPYKNSSAPPGVSYLWYPGGETTNTISINKTDSYKVSITDSKGCTISASIKASFCGTQAGGGVPSVSLNNGYELIGNGLSGSGDYRTKSTTSSVQSPNAVGYNKNIFNTDGNELISGTGFSINSLVPIGNSVVATAIVPKIVQDNIEKVTEFLTVNEYFLFSLTQGGQLYYNKIIEKTEAIAEVSASEKTVFLQKNLNGKMTVSKYVGDANIYYLMVQDIAGKFYSYKINSFGVTGPIDAGNGAISNGASQMKFNQEVSKFAHTINTASENYIEICDFNANNGTLSNCKKVLTTGKGNQYVKGLEWTQEGDYLYYTIASNSPTLGRVEVSSQKNQLVSVDSTGLHNYGNLQFYDAYGMGFPHILVAREGKYKGFIHIEVPNATGNAIAGNTTADVKQRAIDIGYNELANNTYLGGNSVLPDNGFFFTYILNPPKSNSGGMDELKYDIKCEGDAVNFAAQTVCKADAMNYFYQWDFGDGKGATGTGMVGQNQSHVYDTPGDKKVLLTIVYCGSKTTSLTATVTVLPKAEFAFNQSPFKNCFRDTPKFIEGGDIKNVTSINALSVFKPQTLYSWKAPLLPAPGDPTKFLAKKEGPIELEIGVRYTVGSVQETCKKTFKGNIDVTCAVFLVPEIISLNGDNINDKLEIVYDKILKTNFQFRIFNRWGELLYFTNKLDVLQWNGTYNGEKLKPDTYAWSAQYETSINPGIIVKKTGAIVLVR